MKAIKTKIQKIFSHRIAYWLGVIGFGVIFGVSLQFVKAWTAPTAAPPGGNVGAPINTSSSAQTKSGDLTVKNLTTNSDIYAKNGSIYTRSIAATRNIYANNFAATGNVWAHNVISSRNVYATNGTIWAQKIGVSGHIYSQGNIYANDFYIRKMNKWASQLGGGLTNKWGSCYTARTGIPSSGIVYKDIGCRDGYYMTSFGGFGTNSFTIQCCKVQ